MRPVDAETSLHRADQREARKPPLHSPLIVHGLCRATCFHGTGSPSSKPSRPRNRVPRRMLTMAFFRDVAARFQTPEQSGHPNHPHQVCRKYLRLRKGATGVQLAIPIFPGGMDGRFRTLAAGQVRKLLEISLAW